MLETRALTIAFDGVVLVDAVGIAARAGAVTAILGANGAGKSTLFHTIAGSVIPTAGEVLMFGRPVRDWPAREAARLRAVLVQNPSLGFDFLVREAVALGRIPHDTDERTNRRIAEEALAAVGLAEFAQRRYLSLSGGEKQRVHLARALAQVWDQPETQRCLLLDEPTLNLDFTQKRSILETARQFAQRGGTVLVVLHELNLAAQFADHLVLLKRGQVVAQGDAHTVLTRAHIEHAYGGSARILEDPQTGLPIVL